ncbi:MAG: hypothetical protein ACFFDI_32455 [Promethearchaeota archaeon]
MNNDLITEKIRKILHETAIDLGQPGWDQYYGYGLLNTSAAVSQAHLSLRFNGNCN